MKDSCYERDNDGDLNDDEVFPNWCWSRHSKSVEDGERGCLDAFYGGMESVLYTSYSVSSISLRSAHCIEVVFWCTQLRHHLLRVFHRRLEVETTGWMEATCAT